MTEITFTKEEAELLDKVKSLFVSKSNVGYGSEFRKHFIAEAMENHCLICGCYTAYSDGDGRCYCERYD